MSDDDSTAPPDRAIAGGGTFAVPTTMEREPLPPGWRLDADGVHFNEHGDTVYCAVGIDGRMWTFSMKYAVVTPRPYYYPTAREAMDRVDELRRAAVEAPEVEPRAAMERPTCGTCPYWDIPEGFERHATDQWDCHKRSPQLITATYLAGAAAVDQDPPGPFEGAWPQTKGSEWCGEHPSFPAYLAESRGASKPEAKP